MDLNIRAPGLKLSSDTKDFIDRKFSKLDKLAEHVVDAHLELKKDSQRVGTKLIVAQLTLQTGRHTLRAEEHDSDVTKAVDAAVDKLIKQVRKFNNKRSDRKKRGLPASTGAPRIANYLALPVDSADLNGDGLDEMDEGGHVVRTKRFPMKPMIVEEAIDQMELIGHDFFLFQNADEDELNVLYRRRDGSYGLLAPFSS